MRLMLLFLLMGPPAFADVIVATRTLRPQTVVTAADLAIRPGDIAGVPSDPAELIGLETRVALYAGHPVRRDDVGEPAVVDRNEIVPLLFERGGLTIQVVGRALARAGAGDRLRVMNLDSRTVVWGSAQPDGTVIVK